MRDGAAAWAASKLCSPASRLLIRMAGGDDDVGCRRRGDVGSAPHSPHGEANVCVGRASSRRLSQNVGGGVAHLSHSLKPGSR